jgi:hypothetical protein
VAKFDRNTSESDIKEAFTKYGKINKIVKMH